MKRIRDGVAGLDVHRDKVVACCRIVEPDGEIETTKQTFSTNLPFQLNGPRSWAPNDSPGRRSTG